MESRIRGVLSGVALAVAMLVSSQEALLAEEARPKNPYEGRTDLVNDGRSLLNQYCSHCHGPNAVQGERPRDLRRLKIRYGDDAIVVFWTTVHTGRMDKGMPVWAGVLDDETLWRIFTYLQTVQTEE